MENVATYFGLQLSKLKQLRLGALAFETSENKQCMVTLLIALVLQVVLSSTSGRPESQILMNFWKNSKRPFICGCGANKDNCTQTCEGSLKTGLIIV